MYVEHTGTSVKTLLVTNYAELEEVIGQVKKKNVLQKYITSGVVEIE